MPKDPIIGIVTPKPVIAVVATVAVVSESLVAKPARIDRSLADTCIRRASSSRIASAVATIWLTIGSTSAGMVHAAQCDNAVPTAAVSAATFRKVEATALSS